MNVNQLFDDFSKRKILVLGDVMIDAYLEGKVNRVSPEAPVPIVSFTSQEQRLGGAANVALNLLSLGAQVTICSVVGEDQSGQDLKGLMVAQSISTEGLVFSPHRKTTLKTRVIGNNQQLLRVDNEQTDDILPGEEDALVGKIEALLASKFDAIIFEDYNKGVLTASLIERVIALAKKFNVVTTVDPKLTNFYAYNGVTLFKPNLKELRDGVKRMVDVRDRKDFEAAVEEMNRVLQAENVFVTLSEHGVYIQNDSAKHYIPAHIRNIADVSGAGDTVISVATLCYLAGLPIDEVAAVANLAGGLVCERVGVVAIDKAQLKSELEKL
ncbi:MAG: PfkB family carbohydrate kinase [Crocinitomicaceae bacterium]|nr:PfkB family carbohydrate kinase [Crocinitomicaceae bacterium]